MSFIPLVQTTAFSTLVQTIDYTYNLNSENCFDNPNQDDMSIEHTYYMTYSELWNRSSVRDRSNVGQPVPAYMQKHAM